MKFWILLFWVLSSSKESFPSDVLQFVHAYTLDQIPLESRYQKGMDHQLRRCDMSWKLSSQTIRSILRANRVYQMDFSRPYQAGEALGRQFCGLSRLARPALLDARVQKLFERELRVWMTQWELIPSEPSQLKLQPQWLEEQLRMRNKEGVGLVTGSHLKTGSVVIKEAARQSLQRYVGWLLMLLKRHENLRQKQNQSRHAGFLLLLWVPVIYWLSSVFKMRS